MMSFPLRYSDRKMKSQIENSPVVNILLSINDVDCICNDKSSII